MPTSGPITVHVMHTDSVMSAGIAAILATQSQMRLSLVDNAQWETSGADVVITDYDCGLRLSGCAPSAARPPRILVLTQQEKEWAVRRAVSSGVHGYVLQSCRPEELLEAVRMIRGGRRYLSDPVARCLAESMTRTDLTRRETDVLNLLGKGYCNKSIARELGIGLGTVKTHLKFIMGKLNATARTHAVVLAAERGLLKSGNMAGH